MPAFNFNNVLTRLTFSHTKKGECSNQAVFIVICNLQVHELEITYSNFWHKGMVT